MLSNKVTQPIQDSSTNYTELWEEIIAKQVEFLYEKKDTFIKAYEQDPDLMFNKIIHSLQIIPIDVKETLTAFYNKTKVSVNNVVA